MEQACYILLRSATTTIIATTAVKSVVTDVARASTARTTEMAGSTRYVSAYSS